MAQKILIKKSTVAGKVPTAYQLDIGELAVNTADALLYTKHSDNQVVPLAGGSGGGGLPPIVPLAEYTIGVGGNFSTLNDALTYISTRTIKFTGESVSVTLKLLSGFILKEQLFVYDHDFSYVSIESEDSEVLVDASKISSTAYGLFPVFTACRGSLPLLNTLFRMSNMGAAHGTTVGVFSVQTGSVACVFSGKGVIGAHYGAYCHHGGTAYLAGGNFSNSIVVGVFANRGATIAASGVNCSGAGSIGVTSRALSRIDAETSNVSGVPLGYQVLQGGQLLISPNATGSTSQSPNTYTAQGIIYK